MLEVRRGDVVLVAFSFVADNQVQRKLRPAVVVQADRYNRRRAAVIIAAVTTSAHQARLPCKLLVARDSPDGQRAGLRLDSVIDCQTIATLPKTEIVRRIGRFGAEFMSGVDRALGDALGLRLPPEVRPSRR